MNELTEPYGVGTCMYKETDTLRICSNFHHWKVEEPRFEPKYEGHVFNHHTTAASPEFIT